MGSHKVEAEYSGDTSFGASLGILTVKIGKAASLVTLSSSADPATVGEPAILTAAVTDSAGTPATGPVVFKEGTTIYGTASVENGEAQIPLPMLSAGTHKITAQYAGDATDSPATSAVLKLTVVGATTSTTLATDTQPAIYGQIVTFTATIESGAGTPDGSVTFKNGSALLGSATIVGGRAQLAVNALGAGTHTIHAFYNGSSRFSASTQSLQQIVEKAGTATTLASSSNPSSLGSPVTFSATLTSTSGAVPTGNVTFEDGAQTLGTVPLVGGEAQWIANALASGSHTITATYDPLGSFAGSKATLAQAVQ
jgi:predicted secreted protein